MVKNNFPHKKSLILRTLNNFPILLIGMRCRMKDMRAGDVVKITDGFHYFLPAGLTDGDSVKLISFDCGYWTVEKEGQQFLVFLARIDPGFEYEIGGRWFPETDWRVKAFKELNPTSEKARAIANGSMASL
jgi:hypothetical protein